MGITLVIVLVFLFLMMLLLKHFQGLQKLTALILICYFIIIVLITLGTREPSTSSKVELNPLIVYQTVFQSIVSGVKAYGLSEIPKRVAWYSDALIRTGLNLLLFIPMGLLLPPTFRFFSCWWRILLTGLILSLLIETIQLITHLGWFDTSDLLHNTLGTLIGYGLYKKWILQQGNYEKREF